ncbi:WYL domain-containing protein [Catenovulum maritimum]|uniref:Transcriptional regulator n=1 Tax=Catenovulum maritimum TaxID=1513271 RepID=A0A0J8H0B9_9ALTE|nr:WYL domain-containing protein [Catenovulum maritimum]KMT66924.1 transcriptional regulator [Catenovulum maritimum]
MPQIALDSLTHAQKERLAFIDFSLQYFGQVARADLIQRFKTGLAASTRDLTAYRELAPHNLELLHQTKNYHRTEAFKPIFTHNPESILAGLCRGFGDGLSSGQEVSENCFDAISLVHPKSEIIAAIMRAINNQQAITCDYVSLSSGPSTREIVPHALVNNGNRWHVRAFDRKSNEFRDFVCTRIQNVTLCFQPVNEHPENVVSYQSDMKPEEHKSNDRQWNKIVSVVLKPHPAIKHKSAIELDYNMHQGQLMLEVRASVLGYLLRQWNVDCTDNASLQGNEYQLWLSNVNQIKAELTGIADLAIAPGYHAAIVRPQSNIQEDK